MRAVIFGAGQSGRKLFEILNRNNYKVAAFIDNDQSLHGSALCGIPVYPADEINEIAPDLVFIAALGAERQAAIAGQLEGLGFGGDRIKSIDEIRGLIDVRAGIMRLCAHEIEKRGVEGAVAELGVYRGDFAAEIGAAFPERKLYLFDTFEGFDARDISVEKERGFSKAVTGDFSDTDIECVKKRLGDSTNAVFVKGYFPESAAGIEDRFAFVSIDADLYLPVYEGLRFFYPKTEKGGYILVHDYDNARFRGPSEAVCQFCAETGVYLTPLCDLHGSAIIVR